jgi:ankyrin repeat protein
MLQQSEHEGASFFDSFDRLWDVFVNLAQKRNAGETVCILDALDECQQDGFLRLSAKIRSLFLEQPNNRPRLKFLLTSRPYEHVRWEFQELEDLMPTIHLAGESEIEVGKIIKEIDLVIQSRIRSIGIKRRLTEAERTHILNLMTAVQNRTYLWVSLTLNVIERMHGFSRGNVIKSLETLPRTVDEAYENILRRSADPERALKALHLIVAARRPLSVAELSIAMVLNEHDNSYFHIQDLLEPEDRFAQTLRNLCGLFVVIIDRRIYFLHQTAREFLVYHTASAWVCEDDLSIDCFKTSWKHSIRLYIADKILAQACIWYLTSELPMAQDSIAHEFNQYAFKSYASQYWDYHFRLSNIQSSAAITQSALQLCQEFSSDTQDLPLANPLATATYLGLHQVVKVLVETPGIDINAEDEDCRKPLSWAAERGFTEIVKILLSLEHIAVDSRDLGYPRKTPLHHAAIEGHAEIVQLLLKTHKVNVNRMWSMASQDSEHAEIVHNDIWNSATHLDLGDPWTDTALCWAARNGHSTVVRLLLEQSEIEVDAKNHYGETALMRAETRGEDDIVALLLMTGRVDVNAVDRHGLSVIERSTLRAQGKIVELLLRTGNVDANAQKAAFITATARGDEKILKALLSLGNLDANILDEDGDAKSLDEDGYDNILDEHKNSLAFIMSNIPDQDVPQLVKTEAELLDLRRDLKLSPIQCKRYA